MQHAYSVEQPGLVPELRGIIVQARRQYMSNIGCTWVCLDRTLGTLPGPGSVSRRPILLACGWMDLPGAGRFSRAPTKEALMLQLIGRGWLD